MFLLNLVISGGSIGPLKIPSMENNMGAIVLIMGLFF
jgi:hypothetical protein